MREDGPDGKPAIYWLGYKSQLLRCAPRHVRPEIGRPFSTLLSDFEGRQGCGPEVSINKSTRIADLTITNRNYIDDDDDDDGCGDEIMDEPGSEIEEQPTRRRRFVDPVPSLART